MELSFWPGLFGRLGQEMTGKPTGKKNWVEILPKTFGLRASL
jgi:hypothetical protein